jgi:hypothetical protein
MLEIEIEKNVNGNVKDTSINVDKVMKVARESFL